MSNVVRARVRSVVALGVVIALAAACGSSTTSTPTAGSSVPAAGGAATAAGKERPVLGPADSTATPTTGGQVVFALEAEPDGLDPSRSSFDASGHLMASAVFDPLATLDAEGKAVPYLASGIDPSEDSKVWTITLRPGVTFHDGSPLDSAALKTNFDYWTQSFITAPSLVSVDHVDVVDPLTVKVTINSRGRPSRTP
jgi:peptide/nickel transport system substrate-binding protein